MENTKKQEPLNHPKELAHTAYHLEFHTSKHGIKLEKSKIFFIIFIRFVKELKEFTQTISGKKLYIFKAMTVQEENTQQPILDPMYHTYSQLLKNHDTIVRAIFEAFRHILNLLKSEEINAALSSIKTLKHRDAAWIKALPHYNWKALYTYLQQLEEIDWKLLLLKPQALDDLKKSYYTLKDQYYSLTLIDLLPDLKRLSTKIFKLRYHSIHDKTQFSNYSTSKDLYTHWRALSDEFTVFSEKWNGIASSLQKKPLNKLTEALLKEYQSLSNQYYSLLNYHLPILLEHSRKESQHKIQVFSHSKQDFSEPQTQYSLKKTKLKTTHSYNKTYLDKLLSIIFLPDRCSALEECSDTSSSGCVTPIMA